MANLMQEVEALTGSAIRVSEAFEFVRAGLGRVDDNNYRNSDGTLIERFQPTWAEYQGRWNDLLWNSRDAATSTEAYIRDFLEVIVPEVDAIEEDNDLADARVDLNAFINRVDAMDTVYNAHTCVKDFDELCRDVGDFKKRFHGFAQQQRNDLANVIPELDQKIQNCASRIKYLSIALVATFVVGTIAWLIPLECLTATVAPAIIVEGIGLLYRTLQKQNLERDRYEAQSQLNDLHQMEADMTCIGDSLRRFSTIWSTVRHEARFILNRLNGAVGDQGSKRAFKNRITLMTARYSGLSEALSLYATRVCVTPQQI